MAGAGAGPVGTTRWRGRVAAGLGVVFLVLLYSLATRGWLMLRRSDSHVAWGLLIIALYLTAVSAGPEANSRFRLPLMPFIAGVAAVGGAVRRV